MKTRIIIHILLHFGFTFGYAQVITQKINRNVIDLNSSLSDNSPPQEFLLRLSSEQLNPFKLQSEDSLSARQGLPFRFGIGKNVSLNLRNSGTWSETQGKRIWQLQITSEGAFSINLQFDDFYLAESAELLLYNKEKTMQIGPITARENNPFRKFSTDLIKGQSIIIELREPSNVKTSSQLNISKIIHGYRNMFRNEAGFGESASCNVDIACPEGVNWQNEANAVAMVLLGNGSELCSGALLNNACQNLRPRFLTAFHCADGNSDGTLSQAEIDAAQNWVFRFRYESPSCGGGDDVNFVSFSGSTLLASWRQTDFALFEINNGNPIDGNLGITYAGWTRSGLIPNAVTIIHHPAGDVKKISIDNEAPTLTTITGTPNSHLFVDDWDIGSTTGGSSGAPYFNPDRRIIGQNHAGDGFSDCDPQKGSIFGRFSMSWTGGGTPQTRLSDWLSDDPNVIQVNTIQVPTITNTFVCAGGSPFNVQNTPPNSTVTWSASPNIFINPTTGLATPNGSGTGWVEATFTPNGVICSDLLRIRRTVWVGAPTTANNFILYGEDFDYSSVGGGIYFTVCPDEGLSFNPQFITENSPILEYQWEIWGNYQYVGALNLDYLSVRSTFNVGDSFSFRYRTRNLCGWSQWKEGGATNMNCEIGEEPFIVYPNPADQSIEVSITEEQQTTTETTEPTNTLSRTTTASKASTAKTYAVKIFSPYQVLMYEGNHTGTTFQIPTQNLPNGLYILQVISSEGVLTKQILIQH